MTAWLLPVSSLGAVLLLVVHSWRRRGGRVTAAFFIPGVLFGILRGNVIHYIVKSFSVSGMGGRPYLPQGSLLPDVGHASVQVVIGWVFAGYLAWTLSEYVLRRLKGWHDRLFPTLALAALFMSVISYCMETAAPRVGWWYWDISTVNPFYGRVPLAGIVAWFSIATDLLFPVLFIVCSEYRRSPWRWLTLLVFPLHMGAHALYEKVPFIDHVHIVMLLLLAGLALFNRTRIETGLLRGPAGEKPRWGSKVVDLIPAVVLVLFLAVVLRAEVVVAGDFTLTFAAIPLLVFALLSVPGIPVWVAVIAAAAGLGAWRWEGVRTLYAFAPPVFLGVLYSIDRARKRRTLTWTWMAVVLALAALFVTGEETRRFRMVGFIRLLKQAKRAQEGDRKELAQQLRDQAFRIEFTDATYLYASIEYALLVNRDNPECVLGEVERRFQAVMELDREWGVPRSDWTTLLTLHDRLDEAVQEARALVEIQPTISSHRAILGYLLLRRGELAEARDQLAVAVKQGANDPATLINLAVASGGGKASFDLLEKVLAGDPGNLVARRNLAQFRKDPDQVKPDFAHLMAPASFELIGRFLGEKALARAEAGDTASAVKLLEQAIHYAPCVASIRSNYATLLMRAGGSVQEAIDQCETAVRLDRRLEAAQRNLVRLCLRLAQEQTGRGEKDAARATLRRALPWATGEAHAEVQRMLAQLGETQK